ncbi:MAG: peptidylprolyl isomerase [Gudongella sp.]|jgi:peptidyl-prolyl cis-trans isomerase C|nr:peptidylprolyl isomerase [Gudongella sp.]
MSDNTPVAVVNGKEITRGDVVKFLNDIGPEMAMSFQSPEGINRVIDELVNQELLYLDAIEHDFENEVEFAEVLRATKENLLKGYAFNKLISDVTADEEELKNYYQENSEVFTQPETVKASHILVETSERADEIAQELKNGLDFEQAARDYSKCPSSEVGGSLGEFGRGQMVPEFEEAAFNMEVGTVSEPVKTQFGYHIIRLDEKLESKSPSFEEAKDEIRKQVLLKKQQKNYTDKINELKGIYSVEIK